MTITKQDVKEFFQNVEAQLEDLLEDTLTLVARNIAIACKFLRSTAALLAKDPVLLAAIQKGMTDAISAVSAAVEEKGTSVLADASLEAAQNLLISLGHTAGHELVPIVAAELKASVAATTQSTPAVVNP